MAVLSGIAKLETGDPAPLVLIRDWDSFGHMASVVPSADGIWTAVVNDGRRYEVVVRGPAGYRPVCDGPVTPEV